MGKYSWKTSRAEELKKEIPELAGIIDTADFGAIVDVIKNIDKE